VPTIDVYEALKRAEIERDLYACAILRLGKDHPVVRDLESEAYATAGRAQIRWSRLASKNKRKPWLAGFFCI
jgi:hypothetical protein